MESKKVKKLNLLLSGVFSIIIVFICISTANAQGLSAIGNGSLPSAKVNIISKTTVFNAGEDGINSYRIPSLVTTKNGSLLLFCEARKLSSYDKSPTDIVVKRSIDNGKTWSKMEVIAHGGNNAYMDPCAIVDKVTGKIFLFTSLWPADDHSGFSNTEWLAVSNDDGVSWSKPYNVTKEVVCPGCHIDGFGPGAGIQMRGKKFEGRLILPTRQILVDGQRKNATLFSDDHGDTWHVGQDASDGGEFQIAESPYDTLVYNLRGSMLRRVARSYDGGVTWGNSHIDPVIKSIPGGCQGSILGVNNVLFYTGPVGPYPGEQTDSTEPRCNFKIFRSLDGGKTWDKDYLLYKKAAGYSCITQMANGNLAIAFETADTDGFIRINRKRGKGWMRIDVIVVPKEIVFNK